MVGSVVARQARLWPSNADAHHAHVRMGGTRGRLKGRPMRISLAAEGNACFLQDATKPELRVDPLLLLHHKDVRVDVKSAAIGVPYDVVGAVLRVLEDVMVPIFMMIVARLTHGMATKNEREGCK